MRANKIPASWVSNHHPINNPCNVTRRLLWDQPCVGYSCHPSMYWPLLTLTFTLLSFYAHCFSATSGIIRKLKFYLPSYFGITRRNINNKKSFLGIFSAFYGQRSVAEAWTNPVCHCLWVFYVFYSQRSVMAAETNPSLWSTEVLTSINFLQTRHKINKWQKSHQFTILIIFKVKVLSPCYSNRPLGKLNNHNKCQNIN